MNIFLIVRDRLISLMVKKGCTWLFENRLTGRSDSKNGLKRPKPAF